MTANEQAAQWLSELQAERLVAERLKRELKLTQARLYVAYATMIGCAVALWVLMLVVTP